MSSKEPAQRRELHDWEIDIIETAMMHADAAKDTMPSVFFERVRALQVVDATAPEVTSALNAVRDDLRAAVDASCAKAGRMATDWWLR